MLKQSRDESNSTLFSLRVCVWISFFRFPLLLRVVDVVMAAINKAFVPDDDFKETSSRQDRPTTLNKGTAAVCRVDIEGRIDDCTARKLSQILATLPGNVFISHLLLPSSSLLHLLSYFENAALLGAFVLGTYLGWASPVMPQMKIAANNNLTTAKSSNSLNELMDEKQEGNIWHLLLDDDQMSWVGSLINVGAVVGCLCGGFLMDKFGRKVILAVVFMLYTVGYLLITLAVDPSEYYYFLLHNTLQHDLQTANEPNIRIVTRMIVSRKGIITRLNVLHTEKKSIEKHFNIKCARIWQVCCTLVALLED